MHTAHYLPTISYVQPGEKSAKAKIIGVIEKLSGRDEVEAVYHQLKNETFDSRTFFARALQLAGIEYRITGSTEEAVPKDGPLVLVANHPFGVVDGLMLCDIASRLRGEFRILINNLLCRDEDLDPYFLPIDFRDSKEARQINIATKRDALKTLADGGVILIFPGGAISTRTHKGFGAVAEFPWTTFTAKLIAKSRATVVPLFFHGNNSRLFHFASGVSEALRASLLLHEARNKMGRNFEVSMGEPIFYGDVDDLDRRELTRFIYERTWGLSASYR